MVSESKIGTLHVIIGSCWYSCYCACVSVHPCRYVLYVCYARTVLSYTRNVCFVLFYATRGTYVSVCTYVSKNAYMRVHTVLQKSQQLRYQTNRRRCLTSKWSSRTIPSHRCKPNSMSPLRY